jgi:hypothetical protein
VRDQIVGFLDELKESLLLPSNQLDNYGDIRFLPIGSVCFFPPEILRRTYILDHFGVESQVVTVSQG